MISLRTTLQRFAALLLFSCLIFAMTVYAQQTQRAREVGDRLMCVCGCNQVLTQCNHIGCRYSHDMLKEVDERVAKHESDDLILQSFVQEYGPSVLLVPVAKGFNRWVWIMPVLLPLAGIWITQRAISRWRKRSAASPAPGASADLLERVKRESGEKDL